MKNNLHDKRFSAVELNVDNIPAEMYEKKYDAILMIALIEHLIDPLRAMQNIHKLLKPGGFVYIDTPNIAKYSNRLKLLRGKFPSTASTNEGLTTYEGKPVDLYDEGHLHYFTYRSLSKMLIDYCGYSSVKKLGYHISSGLFGKQVHYKLSKMNPELFSELLLVTYK
jgi:SAM-dependent methyltransferase